MTDLNQAEEYFRSKTVEATYNLWNALLTVNGVMISAFSLVLALGGSADRLVGTLLVVACAISILLLVWNYLVIKKHYVEQGQRVSGRVDLSAIDGEQDLKTALRRRKAVQLRETTALLLLAVEVVLIGFLVLCPTAAT
jgi:hypothetical protein